MPDVRHLIAQCPQGCAIAGCRASTTAPRLQKLVAFKGQLRPTAGLRRPPNDTSSLPAGMGRRVQRVDRISVGAEVAYAERPLVEQTPCKCHPDVQIGIRADAAPSVIELVVIIRRCLRANSRTDGAPFPLRRGGRSRGVPRVSSRPNVPNILRAASFY
jgi:hypothetical protein